MAKRTKRKGRKGGGTAKQRAARAKFSRIARACQAKVKATGKARFRAVGACVRAGFKAAA